MWLTVYVVCMYSPPAIQTALQDKPVKLSVSLNGRVDAVKGLEWPTQGAEPDYSTSVRRSALVSVLLPSGRRIEMRSIYTTLIQEDGKVFVVKVLPEKDVGTYAAALAKSLSD